MGCRANVQIFAWRRPQVTLRTHPTITMPSSIGVIRRVGYVSKDVPSREPGLWLGVIEIIEDAIIGSLNGVVTCRTVSRMANGEQWNKDMVYVMRGAPWEPVPGKRVMDIPVDVDDNGDGPERDDRRELKPTEALDDEIPVEPRGSTDKPRIYRKAITRYGSIAGCPGSDELTKRG